MRIVLKLQNIHKHKNNTGAMIAEYKLFISDDSTKAARQIPKKVRTDSLLFSNVIVE